MSSLINGYIGKLNPGDGTEYSLGSTAYAECATAAATTQKEIEMTGFTLMQGATIFVKFINGNTNDSPTLRIKTDTNSYTDIKNIIISNNLINNSLVNLTYDGTQWLADSSNLNLTILENSEPYSLRQTGGSITNVKERDINLEKIDSIVGGSIVWNQLAEVVRQSISSNGILTLLEDGVYFYQGEATSDYARVGFAGTAGNLILKDHVYYSYADISDVDTTFDRRIYKSDGSYSEDESPNGIFKITVDALYIEYRLRDLTPGEEYSGSFKIQCFDLTRMFGTTVANYVYDLEQTNVGAGVAWFKRFFPHNNYAYNTGSIESVQVSAHKTVGFNQWDEVSERGRISAQSGQNTTEIGQRSKNFISIIPGATYYVRSPKNEWIYFIPYDLNKNHLQDLRVCKNNTITFDASTHYIRFFSTVVGALDGVCLNLSYDGSRDGEYEPYVEHVYPLDDSLTLRGIPKLDANNRLYYDGDIYKADSTVIRRYGIVDLGTLNWGYYTGYTQYPYFFTNSSSFDDDPLYNYDVITLLCTKYIAITNRTSSNFGSNDYNGCVCISSGSSLMIQDTAYTDAATFKSAMSGVMLVYELATPTTETANPYTQIQKCSAYGTEEFIDAENRNFSMPVGHITKYQNDSSCWIEDPLKIENKDTTLNWNTTSTIATIGGQDITVKLPTNPNNDIAAGTTRQFWRGDKTWSDTISGGTLKITNNSNTLTIGSQNSSFTHIYNSANIPFIFNNHIYTTTGNLGNSAYPFGNLYLGKGGTRNIYFSGTSANYSMIRFLENTIDLNGHDVSIGGGGAIFIGSGESATTMEPLIRRGTENVYITSDSNIFLESGVQNGATSRIGAQITTAGHFVPVKAEANNTNQQSLGLSGQRWKSLYVGTADSYGADNLPIYWNNGVPAAVNAQNTANNLIDNLSAGSSVPIDGDTYIASYADGKNATHNGTNTYHRRPISQLYTYMKDKLAITNNNINLNWNTETTIATIGGTAIKVKIPANPNTTTITFKDWTVS